VIAEGEVLQLTRAHDLNLSRQPIWRSSPPRPPSCSPPPPRPARSPAGADAPRAAALRAYGLNLGLAFQLADDALDYGGAGRDPGQERRRRLPRRQGDLAAAAGHRPLGRRARRPSGSARSAGKEQTEADFRRARELIVGTGALEATLDLAADYADAAKAALRIFPCGEWRAALEALADFAVSRRA
jgi:octaprenyl-diphosphate synthase